MFHKNKNLNDLSMATVAVSVSLLWLFFGDALFELLGLADNSYLFISGAILSLGIFGVVFFIRSILYYTEFFIQVENLPLLLYRIAAENNLNGIFFKDEKGTYRFINAIAKRVLGLESQIVTGQKDGQLFSPVIANRIKLEDERVLHSGEKPVWEVELGAGINKVNYRCKKMQCRDGKGRVIGIIGMCKDISKQKIMESRLYEVDENYNQLFNNLPDPVMFFDAATLLPLRYNRAMCEMLGYSNDEFGKLRVNYHVIEKNAEFFKILIPEILRKGSSGFEIELKTKSRDIIDITGFAQKVIITGKKYIHVVMHDVTEINKANDQLINAELKYRSLFELANDAILVVDINTLQITDANEQAVKLFDYSLEELMSMTIYDLYDIEMQNKTRDQINDLEIYNHVSYLNKIVNRKGMKSKVEINAHKVNYGKKIVYQYFIREISNPKLENIA